MVGLCFFHSCLTDLPVSVWDVFSKSCLYAGTVLCKLIMEMALRSSALSATNPCKIPVRPDSLALMIMRRRLSDWQGGREPISGTLATPESITRNLGGILSLSVCVLLGQKDREQCEGVNQKTACSR